MQEVVFIFGLKDKCGLFFVVEVCFSVLTEPEPEWWFRLLFISLYTKIYEPQDVQLSQRFSVASVPLACKEHHSCWCEEPEGESKGCGEPV